MFAADEHANMILFLHWGIAPEIFRLGGFGLRYYSIGFLLAFMASYMVLLWVFRREHWSRETLDRLLIYIVAGTLIGARLGHCFFYDWAWYREHLWEIVLPFTFTDGQFVFTGYQGLASHGAAIGIVTAATLFSYRQRVPLIWLLDRLALVVPLAGAFIRTGNFFNSEIIGTPSGLPWAVIFTRVDNIPRHPAQLYEALAYLIIFGLLMRRYRRQPAPGKLFGWLLIGVFSARFGIEFVKENQVAFEKGHLLNMGQLLSLPLIALGIYFLNFYKRKYGDR
ncbi:prolipoprotein diacylglyceryl transferase [Chitinophaga arvensicola]|uniref:Phosphatidylglycerol--prolipoprotein diacylglyceryl transferase n=1 Tax=Chitinophaga arvensicola TaxID=29529 RepID=A0A1I0S8X4_9BACT|nr:prolipoprotein diacylglyceryl transferase [Chitinophaga arvensicola]SEW52597.1 prolipoprotein diacylglyceryl transferase [Chitinophaga arvensicola]